MSDDYDDEPLTPQEFQEIEASNTEIIHFVKEAQKLISQNEMEDAIITLDKIESDCSICQGEVDDAKEKVKMVNEICNIEKTASEQKCQKMSHFILENLSEFIMSLNAATDELRDEAYGESQNEDSSSEEEDY
jgi:hypothetical protein